MSGDSNLGTRAHSIIRAATIVLWVIGPVLRYLKKDAYNQPKVPAKAIAGLFLEQSTGNGNAGGKYFILDDEAKSSSVSLDEKLQNEAWRNICEDLGVEVSL